MDHQPYVFAEVAKTKPELPIHLSRPFVAVDEDAAPEESISITPIVKPTGNASYFSNKYKRIEFSLRFHFVNTTKFTIDGFSYIIKLPVNLISIITMMQIQKDS